MTTKEYLSLKNTDGHKEEIIEYNKALIKEYPFLMPRSVWTGKEIKDFDYSYTWLDDLPDGWRIAFGDKLLKELKQELENANYLNKYRIVEIKEKFGMLRWYDNGCTDNWNREILPKYERLSYHTCIKCGKRAKYLSTGWISPYCKNCAEDILEERRKYSKAYKFDDCFEEMN